MFRYCTKLTVQDLAKRSTLRLSIAEIIQTRTCLQFFFVQTISLTLLKLGEKPQEIKITIDIGELMRALLNFFVPFSPNIFQKPNLYPDIDEEPQKKNYNQRTLRRT